MLSPKVSIIIINLNGKVLLQKCLESLFKIEYDNFEVILVDNNSKDYTIEFVMKNYPTVIIKKLFENKGFAEPNNIASKMAKGKYLLFLNNDTVVTKNFLKEMVQELESNSKIAIVQSLLLKSHDEIDSSGDFIDDIGISYSSKKDIKISREIFSAKGASMIIRKNIFEKLGGFDEHFFFSFEDVDLSWRARLLGYKVVVIPKSIVFHLGGKTVNEIKSSVSFHGIKNQLSMKITNFEFHLAWKVILSFIFLYGFREFRIWLDYKIKGKTTIKATDYENKIAIKPNFKAIIKSLFWILFHFKYIIKKHRLVNKTRLISTADLKKQSLISKTIQ